MPVPKTLLLFGGPGLLVVMGNPRAVRVFKKLLLRLTGLLAVILAGMFFITPAAAKEINWKQELRQPDLTAVTVPVPGPPDAEGKPTAVEAPITLEEICIAALLGTRPGKGYQDWFQKVAYGREQPPSPAEQVRRWRLAKKIKAGGTVELTDAEVGLVRTLVHQRFPTMIVAQVEEMLTGGK